MFPKPDDFFRQSFEQWEKQTADFWNGMLRDPSFLKSAWQAMEVALQGRQEFNKAMEQHLAAWKLPSRSDQERLLHQINRLQIAVDELGERIDGLLEKLDRI